MLPIGWFPEDGNEVVYYFYIVHNSFVYRTLESKSKALLFVIYPAV